MINFWKWGLFGFWVSRLIVLNQKKQKFNDFSCPNSKKTRKCWWHPEKSGHDTLSMYKRACPRLGLSYLTPNGSTRLFQIIIWVIFQNVTSFWCTVLIWPDCPLSPSLFYFFSFEPFHIIFWYGAIRSDQYRTPKTGDILKYHSYDDLK